jgi:ferritin-like protein
MALTPEELNKIEVTKDELVRLLILDVSNEVSHMNHYLMQAAAVTGPHRAHLKPLFEEEAKSEMEHVRAFSDKLVAAAGALVLMLVKPEQALACVTPKLAIQRSIDLEAEVCRNYALRIDQADHVYETTKDPFWRSMALFYEEQLEHSHEDLDNFRQMLVEL